MRHRQCWNSRLSLEENRNAISFSILDIAFRVSNLSRPTMNGWWCLFAKGEKNAKKNRSTKFQNTFPYIFLVSSSLIFQNWLISFVCITNCLLWSRFSSFTHRHRHRHRHRHTHTPSTRKKRHLLKNLSFFFLSPSPFWILSSSSFSILFDFHRTRHSLSSVSVSIPSLKRDFFFFSHLFDIFNHTSSSKSSNK